ncbi:hypothetical protein DPMN_131457 [Dreissena polymorpha]|uniref:Uncharacterized protein n=1 Tax=Dreissena polymorpha TaxID=45954 RepID=A0A9D4JZD9_DREPO|nr:hypothetical protein DPMN_131457 [Dreissena polymorpha]
MLAKDACEEDLDERDPMQRIIVGNFIDGLHDDAVWMKNHTAKHHRTVSAVNQLPLE